MLSYFERPVDESGDEWAEGQEEKFVPEFVDAPLPTTPTTPFLNFSSFALFFFLLIAFINIDFRLESFVDSDCSP